MSAYIRRLATGGYVVEPEIKELLEPASQTKRIAGSENILPKDSIPQGISTEPI